MRSLTLFLMITLTAACGPMTPPDQEADGGSPSADGATPDGPEVPDASPPGDGATPEPTCETITWAATTTDPPHGLLLPAVDLFSRFTPVTDNSSGGIGIGDDSEVSSGETLAIQFTRHVRLLSYTVRGGQHHSQYTLTTGAVTAQEAGGGEVQVSENLTALKLSGATVTGETVLESMTYEICSDSPVVIPPPRCWKHVQSFQNDFDLLFDLTLPGDVVSDAFRRGVGPGDDGRLTVGESMVLTWNPPRFVHNYNWILRDSDGADNTTHEYLVTLSDGTTITGNADSDTSVVPIQQPDVASLTISGLSLDKIVVSGVSYITCEE